MSAMLRTRCIVCLMLFSLPAMHFKSAAAQNVGCAALLHTRIIDCITSATLLAAETSAIPRQVLDWQKAARDCTAQGNTAQAVSYCRQIIQSDPNASYALDAQRQIVTVYVQTGKIEQAKTALAELKKNYASRPEYVKQVHELGWDFIQKGDYTTALQVYKDLQTQFPNHERSVWFQRSVVQTYLEQGDITKANQAVEDLKNNHQSHPDYANQMVTTADRLRGKKQYLIAGGIYNCLLRNLPEHKDVVIWKRMQIQNALDSGQMEIAKTEVKSLFSAYKDKPAFVKQTYELGWEFVKRQDYAAALAIYTDLKQQFPTHELAARFQGTIARMYVEQGDMEKVRQAVEDLKNNYQSHPDYVNQMITTASRLRGKNQYNTAAGIYETLLKQQPADNQAVFWKRMQITNALDSGQTEKAKTEVETLFSSYKDKPEFVRQAHELGWDFVKKQDYVTALKIYADLQKQFPNNRRAAGIQRSIVQACLEQGDTTNALQAVEQLKTDFQSSPDYIDQMEKLVGLLVDKEQPVAAKGVCDTLLAKYPDHPRLPWFLQAKARSEAWMKRRDLADTTVAMMQQKCANDPNYHDAMSWTAYEYRRAGYYQRAIELYESLLARNPGSKVQVRSIAGIAQAYARLGEDQKVLEKVRQLLSQYLRTEADGVAFYIFGIAEEYYIMAEQAGESTDPKTVTTLYQNAIDIWKTGLQNLPLGTPYRPNYVYYVGLSHHRIKEYEQAMTYYQLVIEKWPAYEKLPVVRFMLGQCYQSLKQTGKIDAVAADEQTAEAYIEIINHYPDSFVAAPAKAWLNSYQIK